MTAILKWCIQTNPQALEIHSEASRALPCCFNHPWPVDGHLTPCVLTMDGPHQSSSRQSWSFVPLWHKCEWSLEMLLGSPCRVRVGGNCVGTVVLLVLLHTLGALLLNLIYCEGHTPSSAWCCHLWVEWGVPFCRHLVTTEPANQSGHPMVAAL